ncbi:hypothetical protein P43SY_003466 [Pythium insidiosum]|uniref:Magnesium-dependent phosphatase-1 n=1 Tax=Pythium insidiosum TaxID=114742 RepID=A0AAD5LP61_PYTIN|nr:hypothetical protein P43SY_003466 [Pythium insidiosum]
MATKKKTSGGATRSSPSIARRWEHIPRLVVFDLDFTLWYPEMYELDGAPFKKNPVTGVVTDRSGEQVHFFPAVHSVLSVLTTDLQFKGTTEVAVASKTTEPHWAKTCMKLMDVDVQRIHVNAGAADDDDDDKSDVAPADELEKTRLQSLVDYEAIYPRNKRVHFQQLKEQSGVEYEDMLFFDNEYGNIVDVGRLGVVCAYCPQGLSEGSWLQGMEAFQNAKNKNKNKNADASSTHDADY